MTSVEYSILLSQQDEVTEEMARNGHISAEFFNSMKPPVPYDMYTEIHPDTEEPMKQRGGLELRRQRCVLLTHPGLETYCADLAKAKEEKLKAIADSKQKKKVQKERKKAQIAKNKQAIADARSIQKEGKETDKAHAVEIHRLKGEAKKTAKQHAAKIKLLNVEAKKAAKIHAKEMKQCVAKLKKATQRIASLEKKVASMMTKITVLQQVWVETARILSQSPVHITVISLPSANYVVCPYIYQCNWQGHGDSHLLPKTKPCLISGYDE